MADVRSCIFCDVISKRETEFLYEDDEFVVFKDIKPAAPYHVLVVTKEHISQSDLYNLDASIVERQVEIGKDILRSQDAEIQDARLGFHVPPFYSVNHLHLHVIHPVSQMGCIARLIFWANGVWFVMADSVLSCLHKQL